MLRDIDLSKVSDGKLYTNNDMAKTDCGGCTGCSDCCRGMGSSIILDPYDVYRICSGLDISFEELLNNHLELNVVDGIILPNLRMDPNTDACTFLNSEGRCNIHAYRTGICRMFPLGRFYENNTFKYFLQVHECPKPNKSKVKIKKWLDTPELKTYEQFIADWHYFLKRLQEYAMENTLNNPETDNSVKELSLLVLKYFYMMPYSMNEDFYKQFYRRLTHVSKKTGNI